MNVIPATYRIIGGVGLLVVAIIAWQLPKLRAERIDFSTQVKPILNEKCIGCHGGVRKQGGFSLLFEKEAFAKLPSGKRAIIKGKPHKSEMIRRLTLDDPEQRMPYQEPPLTKNEITILTKWIRQGAKWGEHWAYQSIKKPKVPKKVLNWGYNEIDNYVAANLKEIGLVPSTLASPEVLSRRAALDIIGLPVPERLRQPFLKNPTFENYGILIDSLLALPQYGEKWATMWLDLARYADTKGYERDGERNIWRYRDWLIKAFNADMPYNQFITEQLAGDLLPNPTDDQLLATAFHRNTMTNDEGGTKNEEFRVAAIIDRVNTTWETLMGTSFACAQCHSHPYDPFTQKNYYQFYDFLNQTTDEDTYEDYPTLRHFKPVQVRQLDTLTQWLGQQIGEEERKEVINFIKTRGRVKPSLVCDELVNGTLNDTKWVLLRNNSAARMPNVSLNGKNQVLIHQRVYKTGGVLSIRLDSIDGKIIASDTLIIKGDVAWQYGEMDISPTTGVHDLYLTYRHPDQLSEDHPEYNDRHVVFDWFYFTKKINWHTEGRTEEIFWELVDAPTQATPIMTERELAEKRATHIFDRGNWRVTTEKVTANVPQSLSPFPADAPPNRLGLAQWMTSPDHPLTSRTIVNRIWEQLFGTGIVETLEDMGTQGAEPINQPLLDYLSYSIQHDYNWSLKTLLKNIMLSETYRQSSYTSPDHLEKDPLNKYLARMPRVRLSAEQIRDQALAATDMLHPQLYGEPVMPYQPEGIWRSPYNGAKWMQSQGGQQYRRTIYTYWKRTSPYPFTLTFDGVGREVCVSRRIRTNTPLQALATLNDLGVLEVSKQFAANISQQYDVPKQQITFAYQKITQRTITDEKAMALAVLYEAAFEKYSQEPILKKELLGEDFEAFTPEVAALVLVVNSILNLDEVIMKS